ncbi:MAG: glutamate-1-semialdehyde 2,1-aminomutase [Deltaproteobacteria bacterium]|nr:glutamate-1-semialdehyde 2,1-aminomutase [Deltaproteobacteria bacterium]MBW1920962.1 glutamate-1-semialdehyde 2,1-aminomutase [Deltaproteobacteria bacterium]MBW1935757.1 glutamate-1-semialdehyde 2,1-aminomutase [Deltaproteobacteria bacterium]MBW2045669.1 glutamate-1-semialdehyde 2,1-aminomutase [Deltaproteobacteria bacterium]MBW2301551.1 glutamate-1-semialdehyde 2,1-aminomutase [Deltaproteobacteria bacterium]
MGEKSRELFQKAKELIPGGVNSPVRAGKAVGVNPPFIDRAEGCFLWDVDGNRYIDYVCSWGPMILGHAFPEVIDAVRQVALKGTSYGAPTGLEVEMAQAIIEMVPSVEMVRMVNSGTEATMSAIRLARGFTGREKIIKFEGCYHGHADSLLVSAGSGVATFAIPGCPGVPAALAEHTISLGFNNLAEVRKAMEKWGSDVAAIIVEPVPGNMGVVVPEGGFLEGLREITLKYDSLLIFDEVISGFRVSRGGAQELYGISPDLTCLGKIIGGGLPVGAYGGKKEIMLSMAPEGDVYQAGTLSGNPIAMAGGLATMRQIQKNTNIYKQLEEKSQLLFSGLERAAHKAGLSVVINRVGSMGSIFFTEEEVKDFASAKQSDCEKFKKFYSGMLEQGVYLAPSPFEAWFVSAAHDSEVIKMTIECAERSFASLGS